MRRFPRKHPSDDEAIAARAAAWLAQRDAGLTADEQSDFAAWRAADPRHAAALARLETAWAALAQLRSYRPDARAHPDRDLLAPRRRAPRLAWPHWLAAAGLAAAAVAALLVWSPSLPLPSTPRSPEIYTTTVGGYQRLTLPDGSVVELNDNSEVRVRYTAGERRVQLVGGQAHFTVAKNTERPFVVDTQGVAVRAVGTAFDVRLASDRVEVLVTEGLVRLDRAPADGAGPLPPSTASPEPPLLGAGWRAVVPHEGRLAVQLEQLPPERLRESLSWQGPRLVFVETPLAEVVEQFNRRNPVRLSLGDAELAALPVGGSFRAENVESFVRLLASNGDILVERPSPGHIVLRKAP